MNLATDLGEAVLTSKLPMDLSSTEQASVLAMMPVYRGTARVTRQQRQDRLTGFIVAEIGVRQLVTAALLDAGSKFDWALYDQLPADERYVLHDNRSATAQSDEYIDDLRHNGGTAPLEVGTRSWEVKFWPGDKWLAAADSVMPQVVLLAGLIFSGLLSRLLRTLSRRNAKVENLVSRRTKELVDTNELLREEIASRKKYEAELVDSEARFRITFEEAPAGIGHASLVGKYLRVNDRLCEITGYSREELLERHWQEITHPDDIGNHEGEVASVLSGQSNTYSKEKRYLRKDGEEIWVHLTVALVRDEDGKPSYFISIVTDLSATRRAQEQLELERNRLRTLIDGIPDSVYIKDCQGRYVLQNRADRVLLGIEHAGESTGKTVFDFDALKSHADLYFKDDMRVIETGMAVINREEPFVKPDGSEGWFMTTKLPLRDANGEITGLIGITRDVTDRKNDAQEKINILRKLQTTQKLESMGLLAGGIAHDFNNLLTGIHGHAGLLRLGSEAYPELLTHISEIEQTAQRASELCQQMLDYSGHNRHEDQRLDLNSTIKQTLPLLRHSIQKKAKLNFEPVDNLPAVTGDPTQLRQVLMNLVINASDALTGSHGIIRVHTGVMRADKRYLESTIYDDNLPEGDYAFVEVSDNGAGMTEEVRAKIFDPFFTTKKKGRGLGLATVIGIIRSHGGAIKIHSEPNQGTIFRVLMPVCDKPVEQYPEDEQTGWNWRSQGKVLVIDDEETVRTVSARILEALGFDPVMASNGREGMDKFRTAAADYKLVLTDYSMPVMDGVETYQRLKKMRHDIPVVLMSGYWEEKATHKFGEDLAGFVKKPFSPEQLRDQIKEAIAKSQKIVGGN